MGSWVLFHTWAWIPVYFARGMNALNAADPNFQIWLPYLNLHICSPRTVHLWHLWHIWRLYFVIDSKCEWYIAESKVWKAIDHWKKSVLDVIAQALYSFRNTMANLTDEIHFHLDWWSSSMWSTSIMSGQHGTHLGPADRPKVGPMWATWTLLSGAVIRLCAFIRANREVHILKQ